MGRGLLSAAEAALRVLLPDVHHGQVTTWLFSPSSAGEFVSSFTKGATFKESNLNRSDPATIISLLITQNQWTWDFDHFCKISPPLSYHATKAGDERVWTAGSRSLGGHLTGLPTAPGEPGLGQKLEDAPGESMPTPHEHGHKARRLIWLGMKQRSNYVCLPKEPLLSLQCFPKVRGREDS